MSKLSHQYPFLNPVWRMRNEGDQVVLILLSSLESKTVSVASHVPLVLSLMNGKNSIDKICGKLMEWFKTSSREITDEHIIDMANELNKAGGDNKIVVFSDVPDEQLINYDPSEFIVNQKIYKMDSRTSTPTTAAIYLTGSCQSSCIYCYADVNNLRKYKDLSLKDWSLILDKLKDASVPILTFCGGDPGAHPDFDKIVALACQRKFLIHFSTKCFVSYDKAKTIFESGFNIPINGVVRNVFQFSIDSIDDQVSKHLLGVSDFKERADESIKNIIRSGIDPTIKTVLTPFNYKDVDKFVDHYYSLGVKTFNFSKYADSFHRHDKSLSLTKPQMKYLSDILTLTQAKIPQINIYGDALTFSETEEQNWALRANCSAGRTNFIVAPDGSILLCEQLTASTEFVVGNLLTDSIENIWNSPKMLKITHPSRDLFKGTICESCDEFEDCVQYRGQCFRDNYFNFNTFYHPVEGCVKTSIVK